MVSPLRLRRLVMLLALPLLAACSVPEPGNEGGIHDPYEPANRRVHEFNKSLDRSVVRPLARGYTRAVPDGIEDSIVQFGDTFSTPGYAVNRLLQGDLRGAGLNTVRFATNAVLGFGGIFDVAKEFGLPADETDFGETLAVWGVPEGAYRVSPVFGPSTERDSAGRLVGWFLNPLDIALPRPERYSGLVARGLGGLTERGRFSDTYDSVLHESADSYAQTRLIYLQNRRFELGARSGGAPAEETFTDPYEELYGD